MSRHFSREDLQVANITHYQGNANRNYNEVTPRTYQNS